MNASWFRHLSYSAPWMTFAVVAGLFAFLYGTLSPVPSVLFDLPDSGAADSDRLGLVSLLIPSDIEGTGSDGTLVYFDDSRYVLSDPSSVDEFSARLGDKAVETGTRVLTLLADRRVPCGDLVKVMSIAKARGMAHVQIAEKRD